MAYVTLSALQARLGTLMYARLTDRVNGSVGDDMVGQKLLDDAEAELNSWLARRYATPVSLAANPELGGVLAARTLDVAEYNAWKASPFVSDLPQRVKAAYAEATHWLRDVSSGVLELPAARTLNADSAAVHRPQYRASERQLTSQELDGL